jgi:hypothetical protein
VKGGEVGLDDDGGTRTTPKASVADRLMASPNQRNRRHLFESVDASKVEQDVNQGNKFWIR